MAARHVFCYETKNRFETLKEAAKFANLAGHCRIGLVIDDPTKTAGGYHWCTDLSVFEGKDLNQRRVEIYCYETRDKFRSIADAAKKFGLSIPLIFQSINKPDKTAGGYHWCTDLSIFDLSTVSFYSSGSKSVFCYETKQRFNSITTACSDKGMFSPSGISSIINNPTKTARGYHWCTSLNVFDGVDLIYPDNNLPKIVFCYETKERFESIKEASKSTGITSISNTLNNPYKTAGGYHWCTDLSIFDGIELIYSDSGSSGKEKEIINFIKSVYSDNVVENSRKIIKPKELDIYIPEKSLAIEFNGIYWHSEANGKLKDYHINKTNMCNETGVQLIHIFEHQWDLNKDIFKSVISNKLGLSNKIYARKCSIVDLDNCSDFLNNNHLQGNCPSSVKLGLIYNDELVSVMTFGKPRFNKSCEWELIRFCNKLNTTIVGGASKLLKYFERKYAPKSLISYANLQWSNGNLYQNLGFTQTNISSPNYWWVKNNEALSRYQCQKHKLRDVLGGDFDHELSEKENMEKSGYSRLFDCGNLVFIKVVSNH